MALFLFCWFVNVTLCDPLNDIIEAKIVEFFPEMELALLSILRGSVHDSPTLPQGFLVQPAG
jgi:hypothetical protein